MQKGGFSEMISGAISLFRVSPLVFIDWRQDSTKHCELLRTRLLSFASEVFGKERDGSFQQDIAPIHTSNLTKQWLSNNSIKTLPWPARSPDLKVIEKGWGVMARAVYARGKHYSNVQDLKNAIEGA